MMSALACVHAEKLTLYRAGVLISTSIFLSPPEKNPPDITTAAIIATIIINAIAQTKLPAPPPPSSSAISLTLLEQDLM
jgi:hypothetical protein